MGVFSDERFARVACLWSTKNRPFDEPLVQSTKRTAPNATLVTGGAGGKTLKRFAFAQGFGEQIRLGLKT
jgi:hypothetical protein